jgi:hypothetical protein
VSRLFRLSTSEENVSMRRNIQFSVRAIVWFLIVTALPFGGTYSQVIQRSLEQLTRESDAVVVGKVAALASEWNESKSRIQTRVTIAVDQSVKGDASVRSITVLVPGGEVGSVGEVYSHSPRFLRDEAVVVFAKKSTAGFYQVSEGSQGKFTITKDETSGVPIVAGASSLDSFTARVKAAVLQDVSK